MGNDVKALINERIKEIKRRDNIYTIGRVSKISNYVLEVSGLDNVAFFEEVTVGDKNIAYVAGIEANYIIVIVVKQFSQIHVGDEVLASGKEFMAKFSEASLGKIVDMFGKDKMKNLDFVDSISLPLEERCTPIMDRKAVNRPLKTGIAGIDMLYPIGKGQRQLIIGDKKTGKTQIALDAIANQKDEDIICVYCAIGKTKKEIREVQYELMRHKAIDNTIIICALNDELTPVLSLTPYAALAIGEHYLKQGKDVLVVIDDLKRHADAYREIALMTDRAPGREAYPSDIFYVHARLLEKGCQHSNGGSITILPIVETKTADITDYISTNIISITDGQIVLSKKNFDKGQRPAIDYGLSVSRLGGAVQSKRMKKLGASIRRQLLAYMEKRDVYELANMDEMSPEIRRTIEHGQTILSNLNQYKFEPKNENDIVEKFKELVEDNN